MAAEKVVGFRVLGFLNCSKMASGTVTDERLASARLSCNTCCQRTPLALVIDSLSLSSLLCASIAPVLCMGIGEFSLVMVKETLLLEDTERGGELEMEEEMSSLDAELNDLSACRN